MKQNAQKILVWLYSSDVQPRIVEKGNLNWLSPNLKESGRKSLFYLLEKNRLITSEQIDDQTWVSISSHGKEALSSEIPVFSTARRTWRGEWAILVFLAPPKSDQNFRYLRTVLVKTGSICLTRGVYLYPGQVPEQVSSLCKNLYRSNVVMFNIASLADTRKGWQFGDERSVIGQKIDQKNLIDIYSGVSKEIDSLIDKNQLTKTATDQPNREFCSIFDRLFDTMLTDVGLTHYYFPQVPTPLSLLSRLQKIDVMG